MSQNEFERVSFVKIKHLAVYMTKLKNRSFHMHDELELLCVTKGHCNVKTFNKTVEARRGSVVLLNRDTAHSMETLDGEYTEYVVIQIAGNFLSEYCQQIRNSYFLENDVTSTMTIEQKATLWQTVFNLAYCYNQANANFELDCINYSAQLFKILLQCVPYKTLSQNDVTTQKNFHSG